MNIKCFLFLLLLINMHVSATNISTLVSESERLKNSDSIKKELAEYKTDDANYKDKIKSLEAKFYSIKNGITPFLVSKWHITPLEALEEICADDSINQIRISFSDQNLSHKYFNKQEICSDLTLSNISKFIEKDGFPKNIWRDSNFLKLNNDKYIFEDFQIYILAKDVTINNYQHNVLFRFISKKDINAYLYMNNKEKLKSFYLLNDKKQVHYGYLALDKVTIKSIDVNNSDLLRLKYKELQELLLKKYSKYYIKDNSKIGDSQSGSIYIVPKDGYILEYLYKLPYENIFSGYYLKLLKEFEKNKSSKENDLSSQL